MSAPPFPRSEYEQRWTRARREARARGLEGLVVFSRGGAVMDSYADASHPAVARLRELLAERGWTGWTRVEKRQP